MPKTEAPLFYVRTEVCSVCGRSGLVEMAADWQVQVDRGAVVPVIDCGNPWHYLNLRIPLEAEAAFEAVAAERARIRAAVEGLRGYPDYPDNRGEWVRDEIGYYLRLWDVLAVIEETP